MISNFDTLSKFNIKIDVKWTTQKFMCKEILICISVSNMAYRVAQASEPVTTNKQISHR